VLLLSLCFLHFTEVLSSLAKIPFPKFSSELFGHLQIIPAGNSQGDLFASPGAFFPSSLFILDSQNISQSILIVAWTALGEKITAAVCSTCGYRVKQEKTQIFEVLPTSAIFPLYELDQKMLKIG